jgi:hypothetical protein
MAREIFANEFDYNTGAVQYVYLSGWLTNNIGTLNNRIYKNFTVSGDTVVPSGDFNEGERSIYKLLYLHEYYTKKARTILNGLDSVTDWKMLKEGDSEVSRTPKTDLAKTYRGLAQDVAATLLTQINDYKSSAATPSQVYGTDFATGSSGQYWPVYPSY